MKKLSIIALLTAFSLLGDCRFLMAQTDSELPQAVYLYQGDAPGSEGMSDIPKRVRPGNDRVVTQIHRPLLYPYLPSKGTETGMAVIIAPGGGHNSLWPSHEGHTPAKYIAEHGIAAVVLEYRLAEEKDSKYTVDEHALGDLKRAIRLVRENAKSWKVDPNRVGVMRFSAGGESAALSGMRFDAGDDNAGDRKDISQGMAVVYLKYKRAGVPTELHIYSNAGHGFGLRARSS